MQAHPFATTSAPLLEVFASIQGEGAYIGEPQVFVRLAGCPLRCTWCDTPGSWTLRSESAALHTPSGLRQVEAWVSPFQALTHVLAAEPRDPRTISVTGGEPLAWPGFVVGLGRLKGGRRLHLETAGAHPEALAAVLDWVDHVSLDLKLPQDLKPPVPIAGEGPEGETPWGEPHPESPEDWALARRRCLALVAEHDACAKVIVQGGRSARDFHPLLEDVARVAPDLPVFLQPVTPTSGALVPEESLLVEILEDARDLALHVRVVPQVHRALGVL